MKRFLSFLGVCIACIALTSASLDDGYDQIKANVATAYGTTTGAVSLQSPNTVRVNVTPGPVVGTASFVSCGTMCTEVTIVFPDQTLNFIVEDDLRGF